MSFGLKTLRLFPCTAYGWWMAKKSWWSGRITHWK